ncbi:MAG TPA: hypothetical protein VM784_03380 [Actinomycetota bacterium]|nr:hypothetical protein [Actinomycetota bacterium]
MTPLAHSSLAGGVQIEMLIFSVALLVLGVVFLVQKSAKTWVSVMLILAGLLLAGAAFVIDGGSEVREESPTHHSSRVIVGHVSAMRG